MTTCAGERRALTLMQYKVLKNTIFVIRGSGVPLTAEQREHVERYELAVRAYEARAQGLSSRNPE